MKLTIIGCSKQKSAQPGPARAVYTSVFFHKTLEWAKGRGNAIRIASTKYGLIELETPIEPYDQTFAYGHKVPKEQKCEWGKRVAAAIDHEAQGDEVTFALGSEYRDLIIPNLKAPHTVAFEGMRIPQRMRAMSKSVVKPRLKTSAELVTHERTTLPLGTLIPDKKNPRRPMTAKEHADLRESIKTYGIVEELVVRKEDRRIVGGHQRKEDIRAALIELDHTPEEADAYLVPVCLVANLSEKKTLALNLALNKIGGGFNYELVAEVLDEINGDFVTGFSEQEAADLKALSEIEVVPGDMPGSAGTCS